MAAVGRRVIDAVTAHGGADATAGYRSSCGFAITINKLLKLTKCYRVNAAGSTLIVLRGEVGETIMQFLLYTTRKLKKAIIKMVPTNIDRQPHTD